MIRTTVAKRRGDAPRRWGLLPIAASLLLWSGCARRQNDECRAFVLAVNHHLAEIELAAEKDAGARTPTPDNMRRLAKLYQNLAEATQSLNIGTGELGKLRNDYRFMVLDAATLASSIAASLDAKDLETALKTHERFGEVVSREDALVARVNALCGGTR